MLLANSEILKWIAPAGLAVIGVWIVIINYSVALSYYLRGERQSLVPLLGGVFLSVAVLACPIRAVAAYAWVPLVIDLGCGYLLLSLLYSIIRAKFVKK